MEMQRIMEMLVEMKATADADREERKAAQARMEAMMERLLAKSEDKMDASQKKAEADKEEMLASMAKFEEKNEFDDGNVEYHTEAKKTEQDTEMMQSVEEHQDVPGENVVVISVKGRKKRRRGRKSTAG
jgi:hypothetical protein